MSILPELKEAPASPLVSKEQEQLEEKGTTHEIAPRHTNASEEVVNSPSFSEQNSDITTTDQSELSVDLDCFIDHLIMTGKINTMDDPEIQVQEQHVDQTTMARSYSQVQDNTDPETNLVTPTSYLEPIPRGSNSLGVPGDIDN